MCRVKGLVFLCVINCLVNATRVQAEAVIELQPVEPQGAEADPYPLGTVITDNRISLTAGAATPIWLEVRISGWDQIPLTGWRAELDPSTLANQVGDPVETYRRACPGIGCDGWLGLGEGSGCSYWEGGEYRACRPAIMQSSRSDFVIPGGSTEFDSFTDSIWCASSGSA